MFDLPVNSMLMMLHVACAKIEQTQMMTSFYHNQVARDQIIAISVLESITEQALVPNNTTSCKLAAKIITRVVVWISHSRCYYRHRHGEDKEEKKTSEL